MPGLRWYLARLRKLQESNLERSWLQDGSWRSWPAPVSVVRGEFFHDTKLKELTGETRRYGYLVPVMATLVREPDNPHDFDAVRIEIAGELVGYLAREVARDVSWLMDGLRCKRWEVAALVRGGYLDRSGIGVMLWLDRRGSAGPLVPVSRSWRAPGWPPGLDEGKSS